MISSLLMSASVWAANGPTCLSRTPQTRDLASLSGRTCEDIKKSPQCQQLYQSIQADGEDPSKKALNCEKQAKTSWAQGVQERFTACLVGGIVDPSIEFGKSVIAGAQNFADGIQKDGDRQKLCDQNPQQKVNIFRAYNSSVPKLLKVGEPSASVLKAKSCAELETALYHAKKDREKSVARRMDSKLIQRNPTLSAEEKEYADWKTNKTKAFAGNSNEGLIQLADRMLNELNIRLECYSPEQAMALRCEIAYTLASTVGGGAGSGKILAKLSGLKAARFEKKLASLKGLSREERIEKASAEFGSLSEAERAQKIQKDLQQEMHLKKPPTQSQLAALDEAHKVGADAGRGFGNYTQADLKKKMQILMDGGWSKEQAEYLVMRGYAGNARAVSAEPFTPKVRTHMSDPKVQAEVDRVFKYGDGPHNYRLAGETAAKYSGIQNGVAKGSEARALFETSAKKLEEDLKKNSTSLPPAQVKQKMSGIEEYIIDRRAEIPSNRQDLSKKWTEYERTIETTQRKYEEAATTYIRAGKQEEALRILNQSPVVSNFSNGVAKQNYINRYMQETLINRRPSSP